MKPLVVSFFTIGDRYYEEAANGLVASCRRVGVSCHVEGIAARMAYSSKVQVVYFVSVAQGTICQGCRDG